MARLDARVVRLRDGREVVVRSATPGDAEGLRRALREIARGPARILTQAHEVMSAEKFRKDAAARLRSPGDLSVVAVTPRGRVVAAASVRRGGRERVHHRCDLGISIVEAYRGAGLGRAIMEALIDWARANEGVERLTLAVYTDNTPALRLYESLGFVIEGKREREIKLGPGRYADDYIMGLWLGEKGRGSGKPRSRAKRYRASA